TNAAVATVDSQDRNSISSVSKGNVDLTGAPVYDDFNTWAGNDTDSYGPDKTIKVEMTRNTSQATPVAATSTTNAAVATVDSQDRNSISSVSKDNVDLTGTPVYDDFNTWAGNDTDSYGPNKTIKVEMTQDENNPNLRHYTVTFLPTS
ncbi:hypothetical protein, partial [Ligilactobacillus agilis]|uniref:hypothetical protein n=1 Tax=Ligilactobacillus agilis TaxID=1601 RepID=UPI001559ED37